MFRKRCILLALCVFSAFAILGIRFFDIGIMQSRKLTRLASSQQTAVKEVRKIRGAIFDRNFIPFTDSETETCYIDNDGNITDNKTAHSFDTVSRYRSDGLASHVIGYTDSDSNGICGIEKTFDNLLKSQSSLNVSYISDATGSPVGNITAATTTVPESSVVLTIDYHIQQITEEVMDKYIEKGAVVIADVRNFDLLSVASRPDYIQSRPGEYLSSDSGELVNRAFMPYNAGSIFKIITASAAIEANPFFKEHIFNCTGKFTFDGENVFLCHNHDGHGTLNFSEAFAESCNCAFYETGLIVGCNSICSLAHRMGLGRKTLNISAGESTGYIPRISNADSSDTINISIGQGEILVTPLQCTQMAAIIASGGIRKQMSLVRSSSDANGNITFFNRNKKTEYIIRPSTAMITGAMMREAVLNGTASAASDAAVSIAAKTGSAETGWQNPDGSFKVHGWLCGFFPYENPRYAMTVFCEDGKSGAESCVIPFVEIAEKIMALYPNEKQKSEIR